MKTIAECYPEDVKEDGSLYGGGVGDYSPLLGSFGYEIILQVDDNDCQGDSRILYRDGSRYGLLIFGWGSCSGCDSLQACSSVEEIEELREGLHKNIIWKSSAEEMLGFIKDRDWEAQHSWHDDETKNFVAQAITLLTNTEKSDASNL